MPATAAPRILADRGLIFALGVLIAGFTALHIGLSHYSLWFDEYASLLFADQPLGRLWSGWMVRESNPPLFYTMLRGWEALAGSSRGAVRMLPILGGALQMALLGAIAHRLAGRRAAVAAVVIAGLSAQAIGYSHMVRGYIFAEDAVLLSLLGLLVWLGDGPRRRLGLATYGAGAVVAFHLHTTIALWPAVASAAVLLVEARRLPNGGWLLLRELFLANLAILLAATWWLWITWLQVSAGHSTTSWIAPLTVRGYIHMIDHTIFFAIDRDAPDLAVRGSALLLLAGSIVLLWRDRQARLLAAMLALAVLAFGAASLVEPVVVERTIWWMSAFPLLLIAAGIGRLRSAVAGWAALVLLAALLGANTWRYRNGYEEQGWDHAFDRIMARPGAVLLVEAEAMGAVAHKACEVHFARPQCPLRIVVLRSASLADSWANGMRPIVTVPRERLGAALAGAVEVYAAHHGPHDPLRTLGIDCLVPRGDPLLDAPLPPAAFGVAQPPSAASSATGESVSARASTVSPPSRGFSPCGAPPA